MLKNFDSSKKIGIIAPASGSVNTIEILNRFKKLLQSANYQYKVFDDIFSSSPIPFYSNSKQVRIDNFQKFLLDPEIYIIWCFRGG